MSRTTLGRVAVCIGLCAVVLAGCSDPGSSPDLPSAPPSPNEPSASVEVSAPVVPSAGWQIEPGEQSTDEQWGAYTGAASVLPGEELSLHVSAQGAGTVTAYRMGAYGGAGGAQVGEPVAFSAIEVAEQQLDADLRAPYAVWPVAATFQTAGWPAGFYLLHVRVEGTARNIPVVVRSEQLAGTVAFIAGDLTWQAYNDWGGRSLYGGPGGFADRSYGASFDRPYSADWQIWYDFDIPIVRVLEASGVDVGYTTVSAVAADPTSLSGAAGAISNGHDEYWTVDYRQALTDARDGGTNLAFLGANAGYWRVRLEDGAGGEDRMVVGYKSTSLDPVQGDPETTVRFRDEPAAAPELTLIGQYYDCFPSRGDATIVQPDFFLFDGTGVQQGTRIPGLIGIESDRAYASSLTPRPIEVPAISQTACKDGTSVSTMTYYTQPQGAGVFATGTMNWGPALGGATRGGLTAESTAFTTTVTTNLARAMAAGPMARSHPARDDFAALEQLPATNYAD